MFFCCEKQSFAFASCKDNIVNATIPAPTIHGKTSYLTIIHIVSKKRLVSDFFCFFIYITILYYFIELFRTEELQHRQLQHKTFVLPSQTYHFLAQYNYRSLNQQEPGQNVEPKYYQTISLSI